MESKIALVAIGFINRLRNINETGLVFNCKTFCLYGGGALADVCFMPVNNVRKTKCRHEEAIHDKWSRSVFNSGILPLKKL